MLIVLTAIMTYQYYKENTLNGSNVAFCTVLTQQHDYMYFLPAPLEAAVVPLLICKL